MTPKLLIFHNTASWEPVVLSSAKGLDVYFFWIEAEILNRNVHINNLILVHMVFE